MKDLKSAKEKNIMLQEKINDMKKENDLSVNKIRLLHIRLESNKKLLKSFQKSVSIFSIFINFIWNLMIEINSILY